MTDIDYCDINYCYKKQVPMTASFLKVDQRQTGNKLLRAWQILIIVTATSHKKQVPMTASFLEGFFHSSGRSVLHAKKKVSQFALTLAS